jgi:hypothetical protein
MARQVPVAAYVVISTADTNLARKLIALATGIVRKLRIRRGKEEIAYDLWLDRLQPGVVTVFPPDVDSNRSAKKVFVDGKDVVTAPCSFRAFSSRDVAIGYFQRHDGTLANVDEETKGEVIVAM